MRTLVTGGAGFIGSNLARALAERGDEVRVLDNFSTGHRENLDGVDVEVVEGDLRSHDRVAMAMRSVEVVYHQGALPSIPRSLQDPRTSLAVNVEGTLNVILTGRDAGVRRVVFASSSSVYGNGPSLPRMEAQAPAPLSPYAVSKLAAEHLCIVADGLHDMDAVALRYFNVFGERQDADSAYAAVIPRFIRLVLSGRRPVVYGDGTATRDFTYVSNVVQANMAAAAADSVAGQVLNVAAGVSRSVNELIETLSRLTAREIEPVRADPRPGEVHASSANIDRARDLLGYEPAVGFEDGLRTTVDWIASQS